LKEASFDYEKFLSTVPFKKLIDLTIENLIALLNQQDN
jgi:hypothetical protein